MNKFITENLNMATFSNRLPARPSLRDCYWHEPNYFVMAALVPRQYMKVFTSKFTCNNLYLLFVVIFTIYLQSSTILFSITGRSHWMTGSFVKSITGVTFVGKCSWLVCLTYCLPFFCDCNTFWCRFLHFQTQRF